MQRARDRQGTDAEAIERVYHAQFTRFVKAMAAIAGNADDARDAVQEGFARALAARQSYRGEGSVEAWIWRIALNAARDARRRPAEQPLEEAFPLELPESTAHPALANALRQLPKRQRLLIFLHYLGDLSYAEIARICGISEGTVGASLSKARRTLAQLLSEAEAAERTALDERSRHG